MLFIQADNQNIGLMAIVFIGKAEISDCESSVETGDHITKDQEFRMFHFGGSSHCLLFNPFTTCASPHRQQNCQDSHVGVCRAHVTSLGVLKPASIKVTFRMMWYRIGLSLVDCWWCKHHHGIYGIAKPLITKHKCSHKQEEQEKKFKYR